MDPLDASRDLVRRLPARQVTSTVSSLCELQPDLLDDILIEIDQPLRVMHDTAAGKDFIASDYNRDADSYRSPWSDAYYPPFAPGEEDGPKPPAHLRSIETHLNEIFEIYTSLYFEQGATCSVYVWESPEEDSVFAAAVLIHKDAVAGNRGAETGSWDSIHVLDVKGNGNAMSYHLTSTVMLGLTAVAGKGTTVLSGSLVRQKTIEGSVPSTFDAKAHGVNIGQAIEDMEIALRNALESVYFGRTRDIIAGLRRRMRVDVARRQGAMIGELSGVLGRGAKK